MCICVVAPQAGYAKSALAGGGEDEPPRVSMGINGNHVITDNSGGHFDTRFRSLDEAVAYRWVIARRPIARSDLRFNRFEFTISLRKVRDGQTIDEKRIGSWTHDLGPHVDAGRIPGLLTYVADLETALGELGVPVSSEVVRDELREFLKSDPIIMVSFYPKAMSWIRLPKFFQKRPLNAQTLDDFMTTGEAEQMIALFNTYKEHRIPGPHGVPSATRFGDFLSPREFVLGHLVSVSDEETGVKSDEVRFFMAAAHALMLLPRQGGNLRDERSPSELSPSRRAPYVGRMSAAGAFLAGIVGMGLSLGWQSPECFQAAKDSVVPGTAGGLLVGTFSIFLMKQSRRTSKAPAWVGAVAAAAISTTCQLMFVR